MQDIEFMKKAIELSKAAVEHGNEPFGAVLVKDGLDAQLWEDYSAIEGLTFACLI